MNDKETNRRHFMGRAIGGTIGMGGGFASSFPVAERTRVLRGAEFPKEKNLDSAKAERQNHHLVLDFLDFEREYNKRTPRMNEKVFMDFLNNEKGLSEGEVRSALDCFDNLTDKQTKEEALRASLNSQISNYDETIEILEADKKRHYEKLDLTSGDWGICIVLSFLVGGVGWFFGSKFDANSELSDEKRAEQELVDSRK